MPLSPSVRVSTGGVHGNCWFAGAPIKAGEWIWKERAAGAPHTDIFLTYEQINALPADKKEKWLSLAYQVDSNLMCGFDPDKEPLYEELIVRLGTMAHAGNRWSACACKRRRESTLTELACLFLCPRPCRLSLCLSSPLPPVAQEDYVNHSCDGNCWYENDALLVAMRDIAEGEEIYYDYALTENHPEFAFPQCRCGAAICRGHISGNDWMSPELQKKYGRHFLPHVLKSIDEKNAADAAAAATAASETAQ